MRHHANGADVRQPVIYAPLDASGGVDFFPTNPDLDTVAYKRRRQGMASTQDALPRRSFFCATTTNSSMFSKLTKTRQTLNKESLIASRDQDCRLFDPRNRHPQWTALFHCQRSVVPVHPGDVVGEQIELVIAIRRQRVGDGPWLVVSTAKAVRSSLPMLAQR